MTRKGLVATVVGVAAIAVPNAFADKGGIPHDGSIGQGRPAAQQQTTATAPHGKALAKGHAKAHAKAHGKALAKGHAKAPAKTQAAPPATNMHAKAGKTTICHATGSATNPYVTITISNNAVPAHQRHQDGRDIIPAPAGGCPTTEQQPRTQQQSAAPTRQPAAPSVQPAAPVLQPAEQPADTDKGEVLGASTHGGSAAGASPAKIRVLGATTSGHAPAASASPAATETRAAGSSGLPFTGTDAIIVAILGLAALLVGVTLRRASALRA